MIKIEKIVSSNNKKKYTSLGGVDINCVIKNFSCGVSRGIDQLNSFGLPFWFVIICGGFTSQTKTDAKGFEATGSLRYMSYKKYMHTIR